MQFVVLGGDLLVNTTSGSVLLYSVVGIKNIAIVGSPSDGQVVRYSSSDNTFKFATPATASSSWSGQNSGTLPVGSPTYLANNTVSAAAGQKVVLFASGVVNDPGTGLGGNSISVGFGIDGGIMANAYTMHTNTNGPESTPISNTQSFSFSVQMPAAGTHTYSIYVQPNTVGSAISASAYLEILVVNA
jgi:hypothetical protein